MLDSFIEVTIVADSADTMANVRKASVRRDQIASFVDVSAALGNANVKISLAEPDDFINGDDETGGVAHRRRTIYVQETYAIIRAAIAGAPPLSS